MNLRQTLAPSEDEPTSADRLRAATARLISALDGLEAAAERRSKADRTRQALVAQVHALGADRSKLATQLDLMAARERRLETANREIGRRLGLTIENIRSILDANSR